MQEEHHHQFQLLHGTPLDFEKERIEHATTMEETQQQQQQQGRVSRLGLRHGGGEIVEVQGGHIVRSIGRKDRHSKVCTAKGPRDRRVRLAAHTAIQFYDVQDRLGYDRPSKAVDWLIKKAKSAIDELEQLPAWNPSSNPAGDEHNQDGSPIDDSGGGGGSAIADTDRSSSMQNQMSNENHDSFFPMSGIESGNIADTIKSFFPVGASAGSNSSTAAMQFQGGFPPPSDLLSRTGSHAQDLRLSLQSLQDPILLHHNHHQQQQHHQQNQPPPHHQPEHHLFSGGFETPSGGGWSENQQAEITRIQRMLAWNPGGDGGGGGVGGGGGGFLFNAPPTPPLFGGSNSNQFVVSQRGPLQSSNNTQQIRAWIDHQPSSVTVAAGSDHHHHHYHHQALPIHPSFGGGFPGFYIPARVQGEQQEEHGGVSDKPSSASSDSRH